MANGMEREFAYNIPIEPKLSAGFSWLAADGRWGYWLSDDELCKLDLLTGELTTLDVKNEGDIRWEAKACGKDTVCIFRLDAKRNLRIYYRDLHSEAEKTLYEGVLPDVPTSEHELFFYAPTFFRKTNPIRGGATDPMDRSEDRLSISSFPTPSLPSFPFLTLFF